MVLSDRIIAALEAGDDAEALRQVRVSRAFLADHILSWFDTFQDLALLLLETRFYRGVLKISKGFFLEDAELLVLSPSSSSAPRGARGEVTWDFAIILAVTVVGCFALRNPLKALPVAFYAAAIAIDVVYVYGVFFGLPRAIWSPLFVLIQKCELSLALFVVVMFIGCLTGAAAPITG